MHLQCAFRCVQCLTVLCGLHYRARLPHYAVDRTEGRIWMQADVTVDFERRFDHMQQHTGEAGKSFILTVANLVLAFAWDCIQLCHDFY